MNPLSLGNLKESLLKISKNPSLRKEIVEFLVGIEKKYSFKEGVNVREEITGPIVDLLFNDREVLEKELSSGLKISFSYKSKIARDFIMAKEKPDIVWEPQTTKLLLLLGKEDVIIGGAYFGDQAIILAKSIEGVCHCFEVSSEEIEMLKLNALNNNLSNLEFNQLALWSKDDKLLALIGSDSHAGCKEVDNTYNGETFKTITIDSYAKGKKLGLIMLDIEGGELEALKGAKSFLEKSISEAPSLMFEIHREYVDWSSGLENTEIANFLKSFGYSLFGIRDYQSNVDMKGRPVEIVPIDDIYLQGPPHGFNVLAIKDKSLIKKHGLKICPGVSPKLLFHRDPKIHQPLS